MLDISPAVDNLNLVVSIFRINVDEPLFDLTDGGVVELVEIVSFDDDISCIKDELPVFVFGCSIVAVHRYSLSKPNRR